MSLFPHHGYSKNLFLSCPGNLRSHLCLPTQPLAAGNFIYQLEPVRDRDPQSLTGRCSGSCVILGAELTKITLESIHNTGAMDTEDQGQQTRTNKEEDTQSEK